jgi:hypothetical protein
VGGQFLEIEEAQAIAGELAVGFMYLSPDTEIQRLPL